LRRRKEEEGGKENEGKKWVRGAIPFFKRSDVSDECANKMVAGNSSVHCVRSHKCPT